MNTKATDQLVADIRKAVEYGETPLAWLLITNALSRYEDACKPAEPAPQEPT